MIALYVLLLARLNGGNQRDDDAIAQLVRASWSGTLTSCATGDVCQEEYLRI